MKSRNCNIGWGLLLLIGGVFSLGSVLADQVEDASEGEAFFALKVKPLLSEKCFACHGQPKDKIKGGFDLTSRESFLAGGDEFNDVLIPGNAKESRLLAAIRWDDPDLEMPPKENDRFTPKQIDSIRRWVELGAPWPDELRQQAILEKEQSRERTDDGILVKTSGGASGDWTYRRYRENQVWAFLPVGEPTPPLKPTTTGHPVDAFLERRLEAAGYQMTSEAEARQLVRRAHFDLLGLPPSPEEVAQFETAYEADPVGAWGDLIDRLLASPHYGERWGQHWLDVVRYADTGGYSNDYERSNAWRYRDYVIRAFNDDKPYDEFVVEQIAGDELWEAQSENEKDSELLVATGFLRMGPWDPAMVKKPAARQIFLDDVVNSVGETFLSVTMRCFKCHDHKFDPLPTRDYYRFYAAFSGTQMAERPAPFLAEENRDGFAENKELVQRLLSFASEKKNALVEKRETAARKWYHEHGLEYVSHEERKNLPDEMKPPRHIGLDYVDEGRLKVREQDEWIWRRRLERFEPMVQSVYNGPDPNYLNARKLRMPKKVDLAWRPENHILLGGALEAPGDPVQPGVLSATTVPVSLNGKDPYVISASLEGRRLALARWITHPENPLTARSLVNRVWGYHFGKAIAGNPNNLGVKGAPPTHPELLDWLARDFVAHGWRIKRLHRLIMTSQAYRQASVHPKREKLEVEDPNNDLLAYFPNRRLTAEELRDTMLSITGELNLSLGGLPVAPEINLEVALQPRMIQFSIAPAYQPSRTPAERNRRSIYAYRVRGQADPFLEVFNQPSPNESCEQRHSASVSPQAFTLLNSDLMSDRSIAFARRLMDERETLEAQIDRGFQLALGRSADSDEQSRMAEYVRAMRLHHENVTPATVQYPTRITRSLVEEFSGKPFEYEEILPVFGHYIPDAKPADVSPAIRALADFCLVLLNSNEFIYLY